MARAKIRVPKKPQDLLAQINELENQAMNLNVRIFELQAQKEGIELLLEVLLDEWKGLRAK